MDNCSLTVFRTPLKDLFKFKRSRFFKFQVNNFFGKGGGLQYLKLLGSRLGTNINFDDEIENMHYMV